MLQEIDTHHNSPRAIVVHGYFPDLRDHRRGHAYERVPTSTLSVLKTCKCKALFSMLIVVPVYFKWWHREVENNYLASWVRRSGPERSAGDRIQDVSLSSAPACQISYFTLYLDRPLTFVKGAKENSHGDFRPRIHRN